jgi:hypothetical protein
MAILDDGQRAPGSSVGHPIGRIVEKPDPTRKREERPASVRRAAMASVPVRSTLAIVPSTVAAPHEDLSYRHPTAPDSDVLAAQHPRRIRAAENAVCGATALPNRGANLVIVAVMQDRVVV